jgi:hypothetical protein
MSSLLSSKIQTVTVGKSKKFFLHCDVVSIESEVFSKAMTGNFKEAREYIVEKDGEDPDLFGFFVEYLYRDQSILSRQVQHYSEFVTLARLYAMGERLLASKFQSYVLWRFCESLGTGTHICLYRNYRKSAGSPYAIRNLLVCSVQNHESPEPRHVSSTTF